MLGFLVLVAGGALVDSLRPPTGGATPPAPRCSGCAGRSVACWRSWPSRRCSAGRRGGASPASRGWPSGRLSRSGSGWLFSLGLAYYVSHSSSFGTVYGPLTGMFALLIWSQLTSVALFFGLAFAAQLEAVRAGVSSPVTLDPEDGPGRAQPADRVLRPEPARR